MPIYKVKVKWGKNTYSDVEANTDLEPIVFKAQVFALTGVRPERQKIMVKGITLKDDNWGSLLIKEGIMFLMMGSKEEDVPKEPVDKVLFMEDMTDEQLATALEMPAGLSNLGNTCYMNATVQCLKTVLELRKALANYKDTLILGPTDQFGQSITASLRDLYNSMDNSASVAPIILLQVLHLAFPRFAEKSEHGGYVQQDANECWTELMRMLQQKLPKDSAANSKYSSFIDQYFGVEFKCTMKCEDADESPSVSEEKNLQLSCFINQDVKYLHSGLKLRMKESITKWSPSLNKDAIYTKTSVISRLPQYLAIQFVRFYYKEKESINAKILKDVKFPMMLDTFDLCSPELQQALMPMRTKYKEYEDAHLDQVKSLLDKAKGEENKPIEYEEVSFPGDPGSNNSGYYELQAVLTHKGRSSSSGHYVAWVKLRPNVWVKCDDDQVTSVTNDEILKLSGGGDWHCAYVLLYGARKLEKSP